MALALLLVITNISHPISNHHYTTPSYIPDSLTIYHWFFRYHITQSRKMYHGPVFARLVIVQNSVSSNLYKKILCEDLAVGITMVRRRNRKSSECPLCSCPKETVLHMLTCPKANTIRKDLLFHLENWLQTNHTEPTITSFIIKGLSHWFRRPSASLFSDSFDPVLNLAFTSQTNFGWYAFLCGYVSKHLVSAQATHYALMTSRKSASTWGSN